MLCDYQEKSESDNQYTLFVAERCTINAVHLRFERAAMPSAPLRWIWLLGCCLQGGLDAHSGIEFGNVVQ